MRFAILLDAQTTDYMKNMNVLVIVIRIGIRHEKDLIIGYRLQFLISCILINKCRNDFLKGTVHPKMKILSFTPNLYECVCSEHKGRYSEE